MNELKVFENVDFGEVRVLLKDGEPWFIAKDVCNILELSNVTVAIQRLDDDEVTKLDLGGLSGDTNIINEYGLYSLILGSRKPEAKKFKRWITHDVIPSIRQNGMYATDELLNNPDLLIQVATRLKEEKELRLLAEQKNLQLESIIEANKEKVDIFEQMMNGKNYMDMGQVAKTLNIKNMGRNKLYEFLRTEKILMSNNEPYQNYVNCDWFKVIVKPITKGYKVENVNVTLVSVKGLKGIYNKLKTKGYAA